MYLKSKRQIRKSGKQPLKEGQVGCDWERGPMKGSKDGNILSHSLSDKNIHCISILQPVHAACLFFYTYKICFRMNQVVQPKENFVYN